MRTGCEVCEPALGPGHYYITNSVIEHIPFSLFHQLGGGYKGKYSRTEDEPGSRRIRTYHSSRDNIQVSVHAASDSGILSLSFEVFDVAEGHMLTATSQEPSKNLVGPTGRGGKKPRASLAGKQQGAQFQGTRSQLSLPPLRDTRAILHLPPRRLMRHGGFPVTT